VAVQVAQLPLAVDEGCSAPTGPVQGGFRYRQSILVTLTDDVEVHELLVDARRQLGTTNAHPVLGCTPQRQLGFVERHPPEQHRRQPGERPPDRPPRHGLAIEDRHRLSG